MDNGIHSIEDILKEYNTDKSTGLATNQAESLLEKYGKNQLKEKKKKSLIERFVEQFIDPMIIILIIAAAVSFVIAIIEDNQGELFEPILIIFVVLMNAILGVIQESKAEKSIESLKKMTSLNARVVRDGKDSVIDATNLVPGDIIKLEAGDFVPSDARLIESVNLKCEEAILTGESTLSEKNAHSEVTEDAPIGDRTNMVFSGCSVVAGTALAVVIKTGMDTQIGNIANLLEEEVEQKTPLQEKMTKLSKYLGITVVATSIIIFVIGILDGMNKKEMFMTSVALAVSAIPEGLAATITIILSIGVKRMVEKNAIIRKLPAVETLGNASVICSDKTGTLTKNRMTLVTAYTDELKSEEKISDDNSKSVKELLEYATLCCDGDVIMDRDGEHHIGDPTETSIVKAAIINGMTKDGLNQKYERLRTIPFDSDRKLMTSVNRMDDKNVVIVKGAFDVLMNKCVEGDLELAKKHTEDMAKKALRVIAVAYKYIEDVDSKTDEELEQGLIFKGLVGMIDPPREEAKNAVDVCKNAGIKPVMITGDHVITAKAVASELGILQSGDLAITGQELDSLKEEDFLDKIRKISVYARVSPQNKIRIVKAWQKLGQVVAMTGDGVNDAPALKAADIGCAMGITGTDVAKSASDMTLTDDNFATIVDAVREGRGIYKNIKKVIEYLLGTNIGEVLIVFISIILWGLTPLESMQLLWINLVTDGLPAIALGMTKIDSNIMEEKPNKKDEDILKNGMGLKICFGGILFATISLTAFYIGMTNINILAGKTMAFITLSLSQVVHTYNIKSEKTIFKKETFDNKYLNMACLASLILILVVIYTPMVRLFELSRLPWLMYLISFVLAFVPVIVFEIIKRIKKSSKHI